MRLPGMPPLHGSAHFIRPRAPRASEPPSNAGARLRLHAARARGAACHIGYHASAPPPLSATGARACYGYPMRLASSLSRAGAAPPAGAVPPSTPGATPLGCHCLNARGAARCLGRHASSPPTTAGARRLHAAGVAHICLHYHFRLSVHLPICCLHGFSGFAL